MRQFSTHHSHHESQNLMYYFVESFLNIPPIKWIAKWLNNLMIKWLILENHTNTFLFTAWSKWRLAMNNISYTKYGEKL